MVVSCCVTQLANVCAQVGRLGPFTDIPVIHMLGLQQTILSYSFCLVLYLFSFLTFWVFFLSSELFEYFLKFHLNVSLGVLFVLTTSSWL